MSAHQTEATFGATYDEAEDGTRITRQRAAVWSAMIDGAWHTLRDIEAATGHPQASISARIRDFRKREFGAHEVVKVRRTGGLWIYQLRPRPLEPDGEPFENCGAVTPTGLQLGMVLEAVNE